MLWRLLRALRTGIVLVVLAGTASILALCWQVNHTGAQDNAQPVDAIVVLGARVQADGQPGPDLRSRTLHGVRLFQLGLAPLLICTGGYQNDRLSAAAVARDLAIARGVPANQILLAEGSMTTEEDASSTGQLLLDRGLETVLLVSHPLHLERARILFESQSIMVYTSPTSTDLSAIPWRHRAWLTAREAAGIAWLGLESLGLPDAWPTLLRQWIQDSFRMPMSRAF
jgi:uncharacterized SAM-binding protein YcdF (DUF218 family)